MFQNNEKHHDVRLSENAVITIHKYKNNLGNCYHHLILKYEDTNEKIDFGAFLVKPKYNSLDMYEGYEYNNKYIITYSYDYDKKGVAAKQIFDIDNRKSLLSVEKDMFADYFTSVEISRKIEETKYKKVKIKKK